VLGGSANQTGTPMKSHNLRTYLLGVLLAFGLAAPAQATQMLVTVDATITAGLAPFVNIGDAFSITMLIDDATADAEPLPNDFSAINVGTLSSFLIVAVTGTVDSVDATPTTWDSAVTLDLSAMLPGVFLPATLALIGVGATPDQVMPDFSSLTSGLIVVDVGTVVPGAFVVASVDAVTIAPVPEPSLVALLGVVGLAWCGRRAAGGAKG